MQLAWWMPPACWLLVIILDILLDRTPNYFWLGVVDEPAHLLTSLIVVLAVAALVTAIRPNAPSPTWALSALLAGNLIDADHVPQVLGYYGLTEHTPRPYTHSLSTVVLLLTVALFSHGRRRSVLAGVALGVAGHLFRDAGTAPVALLWPFTAHPFDYPEATYTAILLVIALIPATLRLTSTLPTRRRPAQPAPDRH